MGEIRFVAPLVTPIFAAFSRYDELLDRVPALLTEQFGPLAMVGERFLFLETDYYETSMGPGLKKQLFACKDLQPADCLAHLKIQANRIEETIARDARYEVPRPLNLDPGMLDLGKLVLASTKDHAHRLYLGKGVFGEVTLFYQQKAWRANPWTYPDYQRADVQAFLTQARDLHKELLKTAR